jgi:hypothetical protein
MTVADRGQRWPIVGLKIEYQFGILLARDFGKKGGFMKVRRIPIFALTASLFLAVMSCSTAIPTETPGVERLGRYILRQTGNEAEVIVAYKHAALNLGTEWLVLELAFSSPQGQSAKFDREDIWVRTPGGVRIPVASQKAFGEAYAKMRKQISKANVVREPMDYFPPNREQCGIQLFVAPGEGIAYDQVTVNDRRACEGKLFFYIPGGVQPGRYVFGIDLEEDDIRIPFTLESQ